MKKLTKKGLKTGAKIRSTMAKKDGKKAHTALKKAVGLIEKATGKRIAAKVERKMAKKK